MTEIGQDIDGEAAGVFSGISVSLSSDGSKVAIGAYKNDGNGTDADHVRIYSEKNFLQKIKKTGFNIYINEMIIEKNNLPSYGLNKKEKVIFATKWEFYI